MAYSHVEHASQAAHSLSPQASVRSSSRWLPLVGAGLGLLTVSAGVVGCSRPAASSEAAKPAYSDQQVADAKKAVCETFEAGQRSMRAAGSRKPENPADPFPVTAINVRLAEVAVSNSLFNSINRNPAAPAALIHLADQLAKNYQDIALIQLADGQPADFNSLAMQSEDAISNIKELCR